MDSLEVKSVEKNIQQMDEKQETINSEVINNGNIIRDERIDRYLQKTENMRMYLAGMKKEEYRQVFGDSFTRDMEYKEMIDEMSDEDFDLLNLMYMQIIRYLERSEYNFTINSGWTKIKTHNICIIVDEIKLKLYYVFDSSLQHWDYGLRKFIKKNNIEYNFLLKYENKQIDNQITLYDYRLDIQTNVLGVYEGEKKRHRHTFSLMKVLIESKKIIHSLRFSKINNRFVRDNELEEESIIVQRMNAFLHRNNINREDNTCTVCFENTEYKTKCGHYLCFQCRVKLIEKEKSKTKCPYCRQKLYKNLFKDFENDFCFDTNNNLTEDEEESDEE